MILILILRITLVVSSFFCFSLSTATEETENYIISVIQHLASGETGVPECVFFGMPEEFPFDGILERVIASPKLDHVAKHVVFSGKPVDYLLLPDKPLLMVLNIGNFYTAGTYDKKGMSTHIATMKSADPTTKILVLVDTETDDFPCAVALCQYYKFIDVVYLDAVNRQVHTGNSISIAEVRFLPNPANLFYAGSQKIVRRDITIAALRISPLNPDMKWVAATVKFLNIRTKRIWTDYHKKADLNMIHVKANSWNKEGTKQFRMLFSASLEEFVVLVPQHRVDIFQLFAMPFSWELWLAIILIFFVSECLKFFLPAFLKNDPILLAVCGFEKHDLHKANRFEKMLMMSLIVLMFFSTCAYETRIVSMMVSRPVERHINTIEELVESGIKIIIPEGTTMEDNFKNARINDMFVVTNRSYEEADGVNAYMIMREFAEYKAELSYDENLGHSNYSILEEPLVRRVTLYAFSYRNPMRKVFEYTYHVFVESGIMDYWRRNFNNFMTQKEKNIKEFREGGILKLSDMTPAWIALGIGSSISLFTFFAEMMYKRIERRRTANRVAPFN